MPPPDARTDAPVDDPPRGAPADDGRSDGAPPEETLTETQARILAYLRERVDGRTYLKSKFVAEELGLSASEVGVNLGKLQDRDTDLRIEQWGRASSTTWCVTR